jgi:signal transduction histidine kinase
VFSYSQGNQVPRLSSIPPEATVSLSALTGFATALHPQLRAALVATVRAGGPAGAAREAAELEADLLRLSRCPVHEPKQTVELADLARSVVAELGPRAQSRGVTLALAAPEHNPVQSRPGPASLLMHLLIADAILATRAQGIVNVTIEPLSFTICDGGPAISEDAWPQLLARQIEPASVGRPDTMVLFCAGVLGPHLGVEILPAPGPAGRIVVRFAA